MSPSFALNRRRFTQLAGAGLMAGLGRAAAQDGHIVLGQSAAFTGPAMQLGIQFHAGAKLYFDQVNARGGVGGHQIEILNLDDGYEPDRCVANTERLINSDVLALFGYIGTPTSLAALPLANAAHVPFIAPFTGAMGLREPFTREAFHLRASYDDETALIVRQLTHLGQERIAVFYQNDAYGQAGLSGMVKALAALGLEPVATATVERNSIDVADAVRKLANVGAQAIVQVGAYQACAEFIRRARKAGYGGHFYNVSFVGTQALADDLGPDGAGVVVSQVVPSPYTTTLPIVREFVAAIRQGGNQVQANYSSMEGYLAARVVTTALQRISGTPTRENLIRALETVDEDYGGFRVSFGPRKHAASKFVELSMLTGDGRVRV